MDGVEGKLKPVGDAELVKDVMNMIFDGLFANEKVLANFLVTLTLRDQSHDLAFTITEQFVSLCPALRTSGKGFHHIRRDAIVEPDFATVYPADALDQQITCRLLQNDAARTKTHRPHSFTVVLRRR